MLLENLFWKLVNKLLIIILNILFIFSCVSSEALGVGQGGGHLKVFEAMGMITHSAVFMFYRLHVNISLGIYF